MAIMFGRYGSAAVSEDCYEIKQAESLASGVHPITREELDAMTVRIEHSLEGIVVVERIWPKNLLGKLVELRPGAFTDEQVEKIKNGALSVLSDVLYGYDWRVWVGWPTDEQKASTPWEEANANA